MTEEKVKMDIYFAYPYHSWGRDCNENSNGLLRECFPKRTPLGKVTQKQINKAVREINHHPRKRLGYLSLYQVFYGKNTKIAIG
jgi:IS30 family transposase